MWGRWGRLVISVIFLLGQFSAFSQPHSDPPSVPSAVDPKSYLENADRFFYREVHWWQDKSNDYKDAASQYKKFIETYPSVPASDLKLLFRGKFQLAESYFRINQEPDRNSDFTNLALKQYWILFNDLNDDFAGSIPEYDELRVLYLEQIKTQIQACYEFFARVHISIGKFYIRQAVGLLQLYPPDLKKVNTALMRFQRAREQALAREQMREGDSRSFAGMEALYYMVVSYDLLKRREEVLKAIELLETEYPDHPYKNEMDEMRMKWG